VWRGCAVAALVTAALWLGGCGGGDDGTRAAATPTATTTPLPAPTATATLAAETFVDPPTLERDARGVYQLHLRPTEITIAGQRYCVRGYGTVPGGTIRVPDGDGRRIRIDFHNDFTKSDYRQIASKEGFGVKSCFDMNVSNLHFHGGHVRPDYAAADPVDVCRGEGCGPCPCFQYDDVEPGTRYFADNVLHHVGPGEMIQVRWDIDEDGRHHPGFQWYHPHIHGSTGLQVGGGAAGAVIIEGDVDRLDGVARARERIMVIQQIPFASEYTEPLDAGEACGEDTLSVNNFLSLTELNANLINGVLLPRMVAPPRQVERWRLLHAATPDEMAVRLHPARDAECHDWDRERTVPLTQIARDGLTLPRFHVSDTAWVSPGYRIDLMVQMPADEQTLCLVTTRTRDLAGTLMAIVAVDARAGQPSETTIPDEAALAAIAEPTTWVGRVGGVEREVSCETALPQQKVVLLAPAEEEAPQEPVVGACSEEEAEETEAERGDDRCYCPGPNVNCRRFDYRRARGYRSDRVATVGDTEKWQLLASDGHPFHIHINPFLVCPNQSNKEPPFAHWRDTLFAQVDDRAPFDLLMRFEAFTGRFVLHCHKLNHEDEGMMELVEVCAEGDEACLCMGYDDDGTCLSQAGCADGDVQCQWAARVTEAFPAPALPDPALCSPFAAHDPSRTRRNAGGGAAPGADAPPRTGGQG